MGQTPRHLPLRHLDARRSRGATGLVAALVVWGLLAGSAAGQTVQSIRIEAAPGGNAPLVGARALVAGDTLRGFAAGYDLEGVYTGPVNVQWSAEPALVTFAPTQGTSTRVQALRPGFCRLAARDGLGIEAWSDTLTLTPGPPAQLAAFATPPAGSTQALPDLLLSADSTLVVYAGAVDAFANWIGPIDVLWSLDAPLGTVIPVHASLTVLAASSAGSGHLRLERPGVPTLQLPLQVFAGRLASLRITTVPAGPALGDTALVVGSSLQLLARGFDAHGNPLVAAPSVDWSVTGTAAQIAPLHGSTTTLEARVPGSARVVARSGAISASTGTVRVVPGVLARVRLSRAPEVFSPLKDTTVDADAWLELFALGEDAAGHALGPVSASWSSTDPNVARLQSTSGTSVLVDAQRVGVARLVASRVDAQADSSGLLSVVAGRTAQLRVESRADGTGSEIGALVLSADSSLTLCAVGRDADGNFTSPRPASWSVAGGIGVVSSSAGPQVRFDATHPGTGLVTALDFLLADATGAITVVPGGLHRLRLEDDAGAALGSRVLRPGDALHAFARGLDADGNPLDLRAAAWSWDGDALATLPAAPDSNFQWTAGRTGRGRLVVAVAGVLPDTSGWITVTSGTLSRLEVWDAANAVVGSRSLSADSTLFLHAVAFDPGGNPLGDVPVTWSVERVSGTADVEPAFGSSALLRPHRAGGVVLVARHASGVASSTDTLTIQPGSLARVDIESAADGSGSPIATRNLVAGELLSMYALGRDGQGNLLGPAEVSWILEGNIGSLSSSFASATTLSATLPGTGRVRASHAFVPSTATGDLTVSAGPPAVLVLERSASGPADPLPALTLAADESLLVVAVLRDALGNRLAAVPATWSLLDDPAAARLQPEGSGSTAWVVALRPGTLACTRRGAGSRRSRRRSPWWRAGWRNSASRALPMARGRRSGTATCSQASSCRCTRWRATRVATS